MVDTPISGFSSGSPAQSGDEFVIARSGANYKLTAANMKTFTIGAGSVSIASTKTLTVNNTLTLSGTDGTTMTFPSISTTLAGLGIANSFTTSQNITPSSDVISLALRRNGAAQTSNILEIQTEANAFLAGFDKAGLLTLGAATRQTGIVKFAGTTSGVVSLSAADAAGTWTMKLPTTAGTNGQLLKTDGSGNTSWATQTSAIGYTIDGSGSVITTGIIGAGIRVPFAGTITGVTLLADVSGSVKIDILKDTYANYIFTTGSICASALPALSSAAKYEDTTLTGWTTSFSAGDIFRFKVDASVTPASIKNLAIILNVTK